MEGTFGGQIVGAVTQGYCCSFGPMSPNWANLIGLLQRCARKESVGGWWWISWFQERKTYLIKGPGVETLEAGVEA